ncbi:hypothetical protein [Pedobacter sp. L105]|uniref:hypothetical protein n=1 Tax=Pedobacter sp. L105 TaxID=1641871 RepID=UPI00131E4714|nr:hypothetical protein [Pedobacter sp. L105]
MNSKYFISIFLATLINKVNAQIDSSYSYHKPLFDFQYISPVFKYNEEQSVNKNGSLRFFVLTGYREGVQPIQGISNFNGFTDTITHTRRISMFNLSIVDIVTHGFADPDRIILEVKDPSKYRFDAKSDTKDDWLRKNGHCFELVLPVGLTPLSELESELAYNLKIKFGYENRMVKILVLFRTSSSDKLKSSGSGTGDYNQNGLFHNLPLSRFHEFIYDVGLPLLVDETGYTLPVDLDLKTNSSIDLNSLRKELKRYDLDIKEEMREMKMFVIKEVNN